MSRVRNIFDQFSQDENRMTHALACALESDKRATYDFLKRFAGIRNIRKLGPLSIEEQSTYRLDRDKAGRTKTIPDLLITDKEDRLGVIIEAKVKAGTDTKQLRRHWRGLHTRGYQEKRALLVSVDGKLGIKVPGYTGISWKQVYGWAGAQKRRPGSLVEEFRRYMEVFEASAGVEGGYLEMTEFNGVYFDRETPFREVDAKARLRALMAALREKRTILIKLGADPDKQGRGAIKGTWDFIPLASNAKKRHTGLPHLTIALGDKQLLAQVTIPNQVERSRRNALKALSIGEFTALLSEIERGMRKALRPYPGAYSYLEMLQRFYRTQSSVPDQHAKLIFDLRTGIPGRKPKKGHPKYQPQWLEAAFNSFRDKKSNLQLAVGACFPYTRKGTGQKSLVTGLLNVFQSLGPLIKVLK